MLKSSFVINTDDLYKQWHKNYRPLFNYLEMGGGLVRVKEEAKQYQELKTQIINESLKERIDELFIKDLKNKADSARKGRSKFIRVFYQGVLKTKGWVHFKTTSQYTKGKFYYQYIRLEDIKDIKYLKGYKKRDIMRLLLSGNVSCFCSCPDFLYKGFKYMGYKQKYGIFKENRPPNIRNPRREGSVCKHLLAVFDVFMMHYTSISKDMFKSYYWKKRYDDDE